MPTIVPVLIFAALQALAGPLFANEATALPPKALIAGVPYVAWSEAAHWRYENKQILNPSYVASAKMIRRYWGQDGSRQPRSGPENYLPESWKTGNATETGTGLSDLKTWLAKGVPVAVALPLTPHAHPLHKPLWLIPSAKGHKLPARGPSSYGWDRWASWQDQLALTASTMPESGDIRLNIIRESVHAAWRTVIGYDDERQVMVLHDPSFGPAWEMAYADFEPNWRLNEFSYIARPPQGYADFVAKRAPSVAYPARTPDMLAAAHFAFGYGYSEVGRTVDAEREFEAGLALAGLSKGYRHVFAFELAHHRRAAGRIDDAIVLLRQAIDALPEAPGPYEQLSEIYKTNPSLAGARQAALDFERSHRWRSKPIWGMGVVLRALPRDFLMPVFKQQRGWACESDHPVRYC